MDSSFGTYRVLDSVERRLEGEELESLKRRVGRAVGYFDALATETVTVATRLDPGGEHNRFNPYASADPVNRLIRVPTEVQCTNVTLFHELAHLAIRIEIEDGADHPPSSEEFCSLFAIARQPASSIDEDRIPYFGEPEPPAEEWPGICEDALEYREENGPHSHYIARAKEWLGTERDHGED